MEQPKKIDIIEIKKNRKNKYGSLLSEHPQIAKLWHPTKNGTLTPADVTCGSSKEIWLICEHGHEYKTNAFKSIHNKCPYCSGRYTIPGKTDIVTTNPEILKYWHKTKNTDIEPINISKGSDKMIWWQCECGHEWQRKLVSQVNNNSCPRCKRKNVRPQNKRTSPIYTKTNNSDIIQNLELLPKLPIDSYNLRKRNNSKVLSEEYPDVAQMWDYERNFPYTPDDVVSGSTYKFYWRCNYGHISVATVANKVKSKECPGCGTHVLLESVNDLATVYPEIAAEWHPTKNGALTPNLVTYRSQRKVWWQCKNGHEWQTTVDCRCSRGNSCPQCYGRVAIAGENDLVTLRPDIAKEWHPTRNGDLKPSDVTCGSNKKVWWQCERGHEWQATVSHRTTNNRPTGCPYCSGRYVIPGETDLQTVYPDLTKQWNSTKNGNVQPCNVTANSPQKYWWICEKGHEWQASIHGRSKSGIIRGCPICSGKQVLQGYNDLASQHSRVAAEWHPTKNGVLKPSDVTCGCNKHVWWQCTHGHEWETSVSARTCKNGSNCPICHRLSEASFPEKTLYFYIKKIFNDADASYMPAWLKGAEIDINIPSVNYGIEYDGEYWHTNKTHKDKWKTQQCIKHGIHLIRIRESGVGLLNDGSKEYLVNANNYRRNDYTELHNIVSDIIRYLGKDPSNLDFTEYTYEMYLAERDELIASIMENENNLSLQKLNRQQKKKQVFAKQNQPSKKLPSLDQLAPDFINEWHPTKNGDLKPTDVTCGSHKKVWWLGTKCGHEWETSVANRIKGQGCPYCSNKKLLIGFNDLATKFSEIAAQWHQTKNGDLKPSEVLYGSGKSAWWKCEHGHEWQASISQRTRLRSGCPYCANQAAISGANDLLTKYPKIAAAWHPTKNNGLVNGRKLDVSTPDKVHAGSEQVVWWQCECGHEWQRSVRERVRHPKCPHCGKSNN